MYLEIVIFAATFFASLFLYFRSKFSHWKRLGVPYVEPSIPFGNMQGRKKERHSTLHYMQFYNDLKSQGSLGFGGIYFFTKPVVLPTSLNFLRDIFVKEFQHFHDRGIYYNEKDDPLSSSLSTLEGMKWKVLREKLTPTFTSGKMKMMFPIMVDVAERLKIVLEKMLEGNNEIEIKIILARFTADIIGNCAFGIDCNCLNDPDAKFLEMGMNFVHNSRISMFKRLIMVAFPDLARKLRFRLIPEYISNFFMGVVEDVIAHREKEEVIRNDFMNLMIQLKNTGTLIDDRGLRENVGKVTMNELAAQTFIFFLGGFETSSTTAMFCLHELSLHPEIQEKARQSVFDVFKKYGNELTYQGLTELQYLEQCIFETLRKYPPVSNVTRIITKDYQVPNTDIVLKKGTMVLVPIYAFQRDAEYFPNPDKFDPDRFCPEEVEKRNKLIFSPYLPFGEGPRICIGMRFGMLEAKLALAQLLMNFRFSKAEGTKLPLVLHESCAFLTPKDNFFLHVEKI